MCPSKHSYQTGIDGFSRSNVTPFWWHHKVSAPFHFPDTVFNPFINHPSQIQGLISFTNFPFCENIPFGDLNFIHEYLFCCPYSCETKWLLIPVGTPCTMFWLLISPQMSLCQMKDRQSSHRSPATIAFLD